MAAFPLLLYISLSTKLIFGQNFWQIETNSDLKSIFLIARLLSFLVFTFCWPINHPFPLQFIPLNKQ